jgi:hypothetical protein
MSMTIRISWLLITAAATVAAALAARQTLVLLLQIPSIRSATGRYSLADIPPCL